jgi:prepilin-type N-terminal cleavage/methylation domain-containing protein
MRNKGFTLIELLIVVAIIGILAAVGAAVIPGLLENAKINATKAIHTKTLRYIGAEVMKCHIGESHIMGTYQCKYIYPLNMYSAANINAHIGSAGAVLSDKNPYDTSSYAIKQPTTAFVLGQVSLSATVVSPYMINLHTCIEAPCDTDAKKMIGSVSIE